MTRHKTIALATLVVACLVAAAASEPRQSGGKTSHKYWPKIDGS